MQASKKKIIFIVFVLALFIPKFSKSSDTLVIKKEKTWAVGAGVDNLLYKFSSQPSKVAFRLFFKHYIKPKTVIRGFLSLSTDNYTKSSEDSITNTSGDRALQILDTTNSQINFTVGLGIEQHFKQGMRLDPYIASDINVKRLGAVSYRSSIIERSVSGESSSVFTRNSDGGFEFSLKLMIGANYFISKRLALSAETGFNISYADVGGDVIETTLNTDVSGSISSQLNRKKNTYTGFNVTSLPSVNFSLTYFFN